MHRRLPAALPALILALALVLTLAACGGGSSGSGSSGSAGSAGSSGAAGSSASSGSPVSPGTSGSPGGSASPGPSGSGSSASAGSPGSPGTAGSSESSVPPASSGSSSAPPAGSSGYGGFTPTQQATEPHRPGTGFTGAGPSDPAGSAPVPSPDPAGSAPAPSQEPAGSSGDSSGAQGFVRPAMAGAVPESAPADSSYFDDAVFVGDSVTLKLEYYEAAMDRLGDATFLASGSLGAANALWDVSDKSVHPAWNGQKMRLEQSVPLTGARKLFIMLGRNDLTLYGIEGTIDNYVTLLDGILEGAPDLMIFVQSVTPLSAGSSKGSVESQTNENAERYNQALLTMCQDHGWYYLDVASVMYDDAGFLKEEYCSDPEDMGMHFTNAGCEAWISYLYTHTVQPSGQGGN